MHKASHRPATASTPTSEVIYSQTQDILTNIGMELGAANVIDPLNTGSMPSSQEMDTTPVPESELASAPVAVEEKYLCDYTESKDILGEGDGSTSPIMLHMEQQLLPIETPNFGFRMPSYWQEEVKGLNEISDFPVYTPTKHLLIGSHLQTLVTTPKFTLLMSPLISPVITPLTNQRLAHDGHPHLCP